MLGALVEVGVTGKFRPLRVEGVASSLGVGRGEPSDGQQARLSSFPTWLPCPTLQLPAVEGVGDGRPSCCKWSVEGVTTQAALFLQVWGSQLNSTLSRAGRTRPAFWKEKTKPRKKGA